MRKPHLNEIPLKENILNKPGVTITMSVGQWDRLLQAAYDDGCVLIEISQHGKPERAYRKDKEKQ